MGTLWLGAAGHTEGDIIALLTAQRGSQDSPCIMQTSLLRLGEETTDFPSGTNKTVS